jgi:hypothetical protein
MSTYLAHEMSTYLAHDLTYLREPTRWRLLHVNHRVTLLCSKSHLHK